MKTENYSYEKLSDTVWVCASEDHRFGTDAFLLADFAKHKKNDIVCELGTGCGIISLIMSRENAPSSIYAVDIQENAIEQLRLGIEKSRLTNIVPVCADLKVLWDEAPLEKCSLVVCNPPYKAANAGIESTLESQRIARHEILCNINDVCRAASRLLKFGGRLCMCNRPERLSDVISAMKQNGIEPKLLRFVSNTPEQAPWLFLIEGKKGSKSYMKVAPSLYMFGEDGYSDEVKKIYRLTDEGRS
ncbi:MAG: methyltransferase domain-containing protein [Ruminococcus sp.]|nr:methyltransferase domain-containing protein [Ruminococcus sp.]